MSEVKPSSPSLIGPGDQDFEDGFYKLVQHNDATPHQPSPFQVESSPYIQSAPTTSYSSPEPRHMMLDRYNQRFYHNGLPGHHGDLRYEIQGVSARFKELLAHV